MCLFFPSHHVVKKIYIYLVCIIEGQFTDHVCIDMLKDLYPFTFVEIKEAMSLVQ